MKIEHYKSEGINFTFHVRKNTAAPCPHCGIPACGKEDILWYKDEGKRIAIIYDGSNLDMLIEDFLTQNNHQIDYSELPDFIRAHNELRDWADFDSLHGYPLDIDDFLVCLTLLFTVRSLEKWNLQEELENMKQLALEAKSKNTTLKIARS
ncbi:hypothetical protein [Kordia sp.]|uniref:hypothetical protein n=1 Tax=Kordia sp. TaxID=1965332 RepID=UPI003B5C5BB1